MSTALDPVTQEIIHGKLLAAVDEMGIVLARTSMSPVIYEVLDFACGICRVDTRSLIDRAQGRDSWNVMSDIGAIEFG